MAGNSANVLDRLLDPLARCLTAESARHLVELRADPAAQDRIDQLAEDSAEGKLSQDERSEYQTYVVAGSLIAILQSKARALLASDSAT